MRYDPLGRHHESVSASGTRWFLYADERGSIVAVTNNSGGMGAINTYDEYGIPGAANLRQLAKRSSPTSEYKRP